MSVVKVTDADLLYSLFPKSNYPEVFSSECKTFRTLRKTPVLLWFAAACQHLRSVHVSSAATSTSQDKNTLRVFVVCLFFTYSTQLCLTNTTVLVGGIQPKLEQQQGQSAGSWSRFCHFGLKFGKYKSGGTSMNTKEA